MKRLVLIVVVVAVALGIGWFRTRQGAIQSLREARKGYTTHLTEQLRENRPAPQPPQGLFDLVKYPSPAGDLAAYVTPDPKDGKKHPIVIWLVGGFEGSIDETSWAAATPANDQSARAYREAGIPMMFPSLRGGNDNPGTKEGFYGEVDDVLAATDYAANLPWVDPSRIYLGGHSTGGTLVLLTSEMADPGRYRAVISFGPADRVAGYGQEQLPFSIRDSQESRLRDASAFLSSVKNRTLVIEGDTDTSNLPALQRLQRLNRNPLIAFTEASGYSHFTVLAPANAVLARKILADDGPGTSTLSLTAGEIDAAKKQAADSTALAPGSVLQPTASTAVVFYTAPGTPDPGAAVREALSRDLPEVPILAGFEEAKAPPFIVIQEETAPFENASLPDPGLYRFVGRGMSEQDVAAIGKSDHSTTAVLAIRSGDAKRTLKRFDESVAACAEKTGAFINDLPTREYFTAASWKKVRVEGWGGEEMPDITSQINLHNYRENPDSTYTRIITLGMAKFGLPDVAVDRCPPGNAPDTASLVRVVCQTLLEQPVVGDPQHYALDLSRLQSRAAREGYQKVLMTGGQGKATISLLRGEQRDGDEDNEVISLGFSQAPGRTDEERIAALLHGFWGKEDPLFNVARDEELNAASRKAQAKLLALAPQFAQGIPSGTRLMVKGPFDREDGVEGAEWMWVQVTEWKEGQPIRGLLQNEPYYIKSLHNGSSVTVDPAKAYDYILSRPDGSEEGGETNQILLQKQEEKDKQKH